MDELGTVIDHSHLLLAPTLWSHVLKFNKLLSGSKATWCCFELQRSTKRVEADHHSYCLVCLTRVSLQLTNSNREEPWRSTPPVKWKTWTGAATKWRSYLDIYIWLYGYISRPSSLDLKRTCQDLVHGQVLLLFQRVWQVCTILRGRCSILQSVPTKLDAQLVTGLHVVHHRSSHT